MKKSRPPSKHRARIKVFVSHSSIDTWVARQIASSIRKAGADVFLDAFDIAHGDDFNIRIQRESSECSELLVLLTPWALKRPFVWVELGALWGKAKRIVVAFHGLNPSQFASRVSTPSFLKVIDMININDLESYFRQLRQRVKESKA